MKFMKEAEMPTALKLGREGWRPFLAALSRRPAHSGPTLSERSERLRLLKRIRNAAAVLKAEFGARRVILFGSIAHEAWFTSDSDVDLAVEGLKGETYWQAWKAAEDIIRDRPVDLIELEDSGDSLRQAIRRHGVEL